MVQMADKIRTIFDDEFMSNTWLWREGSVRKWIKNLLPPKNSMYNTYIESVYTHNPEQFKLSFLVKQQKIRFGLKLAKVTWMLQIIFSSEIE